PRNLAAAMGSRYASFEDQGTISADGVFAQGRPPGPPSGALDVVDDADDHRADGPAREAEHLRGGIALVGDEHAGPRPGVDRVDRDDRGRLRSARGLFRGHEQELAAGEMRMLDRRDHDAGDPGEEHQASGRGSGPTLSMSPTIAASAGFSGFASATAAS